MVSVDTGNRLIAARLCEDLRLQGDSCISYMRSVFGEDTVIPFRRGYRAPDPVAAAVVPEGEIWVGVGILRVSRGSCIEVRDQSCSGCLVHGGSCRTLNMETDEATKAALLP